ncbi:MAG: stage III sporulation protein AB [Oscillospiraceae bacterium]|nr:stage III sporulation protein AB [Oscillospiraceae bacterium]
MIKYIGMILIALSCTAGGFLFSDRIKTRLKRIDGFIRFFDYIIKHIETYKYPVERIFADYSDGNLENCGFLDKLVKKGRVNGLYANPWEVSLEECKNEGNIFLKSEEFGIIKEFGSKLGSGRADEQIYHMNLYREKLNKLYEEEHDKELNTSKLCKIAGGLVGVFLCILLF